MRVLALVVLLPLLAGCTDTDWDRLMSFGGGDRPAAPARVAREAEPAPAAPSGPAPLTASAPAPDPFCLAVARQDATTQGFDQATQGRVAIRSYQQCVGLFGPSAPR